MDWETGLDESTLHDVEGYIIKGKEGQEGVTGEGSLLQESQTYIQQKKATSKDFFLKTSAVLQYVVINVIL